MEVTDVKNAKLNLENIIKYVNENSQPYVIKTNSGKNCVVISEDEWNSIKETAYLSSIPGLVDSVLEESKAPRSDFVEDDKIEW